MLPNKFETLSVEEQRGLASDTWCDQCQAADLGIERPRLERRGSSTYVIGSCRRCGGLCEASVIESEVPHDNWRAAASRSRSAGPHGGKSATAGRWAFVRLQRLSQNDP